MGCSNSKLDDEEVVQICSERKKFVKQAIQQRILFATGHVAYIQALKRVSVALREFAAGEENRGFIFEFTPTKSKPETITLGSQSLSPTPIKCETVTNYLRAGANPSVSIEERPQSPEVLRVESYSPSYYRNGSDGYFSAQYPLYSSFFGSPYNKRGPPPLSPPRSSQWDFFWNPFSSLESHMYPPNNSFCGMFEDDIRGIDKVREEEGIPDLEDAVEDAKKDEVQEEKVEEVAASGEPGLQDETCGPEDVKPSSIKSSQVISDSMSDIVIEFGGGKMGLRTRPGNGVEVSELRKSIEQGVASAEDPANKTEAVVFFDQGPTNFCEVIKNMENQFIMACDCANEVATMLEASKVQHFTATELTGVRILNPIALIRSASSRSSSSRTFQASSSSRDDDCDTISDFSEEPCMLSGSHRSTLDRLYAWEKKLYEEVKAGERIRITYEKKFKLMKEHDRKGQEPFLVDKTRLAIRDLRNRIKVSIQSVESISRRIEILRDEELQPQLMELIQGLARMWRGMAECHQAQKQIMLEASQHTLLPWLPAGVSPESHQRATSKLEAELVNWQTTFSNWAEAQRAYARSLLGWVLNCLRLQSESSFSLPNSPHRLGAPPIVTITARWAAVFDELSEAPAVIQLKHFSENVRALYDQQCEDLKQIRRSDQVVRNLEAKLQMTNLLLDQIESGALPETGGAVAEQELAIETFKKQLEDEQERQRESTERSAETAVNVVCTGLTSAVDAVSEFAAKSAEGYGELEKVCEKMRQMAGGRTNGPS
ncbi:unnamed protein product [Victoria cruziana]